MWGVRVRVGATILHDINVMEIGVYRMWSPLVDDWIMVCPDDDSAKIMRAKCPAEVVYSKDEMRELLEVIDTDVIQQLHGLKQEFRQASIKEIRHGGK